MNNPYIRSAFLFLLLLSLNGSPNSKLSRFFSSVVLFLFFFFPSRVCFVCSVYFHSTNSWDCFDFTDGNVWVCVRPGGYTRKRLFIIIARAPATATAAKRKRREEEKKSCSTFSTLAARRLLVCWFQNGRVDAIYIITWRHRYLYWLRSSSCCCCCRCRFFMCRFKKEIVARTHAQKRHQAGDAMWSEQEEKTAEQKIIISRHVLLRFLLAASFRVYLAPSMYTRLGKSI